MCVVWPCSKPILAIVRVGKALRREAAVGSDGVVTRFGYDALGNTVDVLLWLLPTMRLVVRLGLVGLVGLVVPPPGLTGAVEPYFRGEK